MAILKKRNNKIRISKVFYHSHLASYFLLFLSICAFPSFLIHFDFFSNLFFSKIYIRALKKWKNYQIRKHVQKNVLTQTRKVQLGKGVQLFLNKIQFQKLVKIENLKTLHRSLLFSTRKNIFRVLTECTFFFNI